MNHYNINSHVAQLAKAPVCHRGNLSSNPPDTSFKSMHSVSFQHTFSICLMSAETPQLAQCFSIPISVIQHTIQCDFRHTSEWASARGGYTDGMLNQCFKSSRVNSVEEARAILDNFSEVRPTHIGDEMDPENEKENDEAEAEGMTEHEEYEARIPKS